MRRLPAATDFDGWVAQLANSERRQRAKIRLRDAGQAARAAELGGYFGVDGPITYKNAEALRSLVRELPADRIVVETDSPYLSPEPHRGKLNRPAYLPIIVRRLALVLQIEAEECAEATTRAAEKFFGF